MPAKELKWILSHGKLSLTTSPLLYRCEPIWSWKTDSLPDNALLLILDGRGSLSIDRRPFELRKGMCFLLRPHTRIEAQQNPSYPLFLFLARFEVLDESGEPLPPSQIEDAARHLFIRNSQALESLAELIASRAQSAKGDDPLLEDALTMLIRLVVEEAARDAGAFDARAYEALQAIEQDLARKWSVPALARIAEMKPAAFARAFRQMMNEPPIQYVIRRRMDEARRQIQQSSLPIEEIAINLGYQDLRLFRSLFRKRTGQPPEALRENRTF